MRFKLSKINCRVHASIWTHDCETLGFRAHKWFRSTKSAYSASLRLLPKWTCTPNKLRFAFTPTLFVSGRHSETSRYLQPLLISRSDALTSLSWLSADIYYLVSFFRLTRSISSSPDLFACFITSRIRNYWSIRHSPSRQSTADSGFQITIHRLKYGQPVF